MRKSAALLGLAMLVTGCPPVRPPQPLEPLPLLQALVPVNENAARVSAGLKATGPVRGRVLDAEGHPYGFDLEGKLLVIPPQHLRFDVQDALGRTEFLMGSNVDFFWLYVGRDEDTFRFGRYATPDTVRAQDLPIRPDWMIEALGLSLVPTDEDDRPEMIQIIEPDHQELLFITYDPEGRGTVLKEYWLSRYGPRLIERVVYRDEMGAELMHSQLSDYRRIGATGPLLPRRIRVDWPAKGSWLEFQVSRWQEREELTTGHPAFKMPPAEELRARYRRVVDIDRGQVLGQEKGDKSDH